MLREFVGRNSPFKRVPIVNRVFVKSDVPDTNTRLAKHMEPGFFSAPAKRVVFAFVLRRLKPRRFELFKNSPFYECDS